MKNIIQTNDAPQAIGPYSQGCSVSGGLAFFSGQIPMTPAGELIRGGVEEQTKQVMTNIGGLLKAIGRDYQDIVKTTIFLTDMADFDAVNKVYGSYFPENPPARSTVAVAALPKAVSVEIECIVSLGNV